MFFPIWPYFLCSSLFYLTYHVSPYFTLRLMFLLVSLFFSFISACFFMFTYSCFSLSSTMSFYLLFPYFSPYFNFSSFSLSLLISPYIFAPIFLPISSYSYFVSPYFSLVTPSLLLLSVFSDCFYLLLYLEFLPIFLPASSNFTLFFDYLYFPPCFSHWHQST